jgi:alkylresorcinol/alkylpyrone synthase
MPSLPRLAALATAVPPYRIDQSDVACRARRLFPEAAATLERLLPVYANAGVETRYSCVPPDWYESPHGWGEKNRLYLEHAVGLLERASRECFDRSGFSPTDIDAVVAVSTTGIATPSLDALLIERLGLRSDVDRLPIFGLGCGGGVLGLSRAAALAGARPGSKILLCVVELCGLTFRRADVSKGNMVATALFGDGAAAAIVSTESDGPALGRGGQHTWPHSLDIMGWSVEEDGLGVIFSRDIPALTRSEFRRVAAEFLARDGHSFADVDCFVCHPGGAKVLDALEEAFERPNGALALSREVLRDYGNMSAATVMFVLARVLQSGVKGFCLLSALGPGFTAAFLEMRA